MTKITFTGGAKLEKYLNDLAKKLEKGSVLRAGFLEGAVYPDLPAENTRAEYAKKRAKGDKTALGGKVGGTPVAFVAAVQEFGDPAAGIPPRPFFRPAIAQHSDEWGEKLGASLKGTGYDVERALALVGKAIEGDIAASIIATNDPRLAASTVAAKGFEKPLVDSGHLLQSIDSEVRTE